MWEIVGASNLISITTLEQVKKSMAMDVPDVSVSVLFDWTQPRYTRCVVNWVRVNWNPPEGLFNSFLSIPLKSILKTATITLDGVREGQIWCIGSSLPLLAWIMLKIDEL